jgi:hypothetical protein
LNRRELDCGSEAVPYYIDEDMLEWEEYWKREEAGDETPVSLFTYIEPWQAGTVLPFPDTPGPEPKLPQRTPYSAENWLENHRKAEEAASAHALWKVSRLTATCRALGVKRVFGSYDGGNDESFTSYHGVELSNSRLLSEELLRKVAQDVDCDRLVEDAVAALMGSYGAGAFVLHGAVVIDFEACTITDEKDVNVVFGDKMA